MTIAPLLVLALALADPPADPTKPGMVTLDFKDRPVNEVAAAIGERGGNPVNLQFLNMPDDNPRRITLTAPAPVPFWEAIDRFSETTRIKASIHDGGAFGSRQANVTLFGPGADPGPAVYSGPFRFGKFTLRAHYEVAFVPPPKWPAPADPPGHRAEFEVMVEPRVIAVRTGPLAKLEATDDRGDSLLDPEAQAAEDAAQPVHGYGFLGNPATARVRMKTPDPRSRRLKVLRGVMPVEVGVPPKAPSLTIPLAGSVGKTFADADLRFTIDDFSPRPGGATYLKVRARIDGERGPDGKASKAVVWARSAAIHRQIEIVDTEGRVLSSGAGGSSAGDELQFNYTFSTAQGGRAFSAPAQIRVYAPKWVAWEAPFEFADLPLP